MRVLFLIQLRNRAAARALDMVNNQRLFADVAELVFRGRAGTGTDLLEIDRGIFEFDLGCIDRDIGCLRLRLCLLYCSGRLDERLGFDRRSWRRADLSRLTSADQDKGAKYHGRALKMLVHFHCIIPKSFYHTSI